MNDSKKDAEIKPKKPNKLVKLAPRITFAEGQTTGIVKETKDEVTGKIVSETHEVHDGVRILPAQNKSDAANLAANIRREEEEKTQLGLDDQVSDAEIDDIPNDVTLDAREADGVPRPPNKGMKK